MYNIPLEIRPLTLQKISQSSEVPQSRYDLTSIRNLLQTSCVITDTTGKASYNIGGFTIHSLLKLPVDPRGNKDLVGNSLVKVAKKFKRFSIYSYR